LRSGGQIAMMHAELVERRADLGTALPARAQFTACCCPPERPSWGIYIGWLLHRTRGGVWPGCVPAAIAGDPDRLSWIYLAWAAAAFARAADGIKPPSSPSSWRGLAHRPAHVRNGALARHRRRRLIGIALLTCPSRPSCWAPQPSDAGRNACVLTVPRRRRPPRPRQPATARRWIDDATPTPPHAASAGAAWLATSLVA